MNGYWIAQQNNCDHARPTRTIVGGFTCDLCGAYLFRLPHPDQPEIYTINEEPTASVVPANR